MRPVQSVIERSAQKMRSPWICRRFAPQFCGKEAGIGTALLRNMRLRQDSPFPRRRHGTRAISAVASALNRLMRATRIWISADCGQDILPRFVHRRP